MGLGKTVQALALLEGLRANGNNQPIARRRTALAALQLVRRGETRFRTTNSGDRTSRKRACQE